MPNDFRALLAVLHDLVAVTVAWLLSFWLRFNLEIPEPFREQAWASVIWVVPLYGIVDVCFIFREDQRCLHDLIGETVVVQV